MSPRNEKIIEEKIRDVLPKQFLGLFQKSVSDGSARAVHSVTNSEWTEFLETKKASSV